MHFVHTRTRCQVYAYLQLSNPDTDSQILAAAVTDAGGLPVRLLTLTCLVAKFKIIVLNIAGLQHNTWNIKSR